MVPIGIGTNIFRLRPVSLDEMGKGKQVDVEKGVLVFRQIAESQESAARNDGAVTSRGRVLSI